VTGDHPECDFGHSLQARFPKQSKSQLAYEALLFNIFHAEFIACFQMTIVLTRPQPGRDECTIGAVFDVNKEIRGK
jgi:hypothetical protein